MNVYARVYVQKCTQQCTCMSNAAVCVRANDPCDHDRGALVSPGPEAEGVEDVVQTRAGARGVPLLRVAQRQLLFVVVGCCVCVCCFLLLFLIGFLLLSCFFLFFSKKEKVKEKHITKHKTKQNKTEEQKFVTFA